jgi:four helix bundle protein
MDPRDSRQPEAGHDDGGSGRQKLDVYRCAVTFLGVTAALAERVPRGHSALSDQLRRAALSVPLNIAEGSGRGTMEDREARRFYAIARASALQCAAIVDALQALQFVLAAETDRAHELLERIVSMLTKMALRCTGQMALSQSSMYRSGTRRGQERVGWRRVALCGLWRQRGLVQAVPSDLQPPVRHETPAEIVVALDAFLARQ